MGVYLILNAWLESALQHHSNYCLKFREFTIHAATDLFFCFRLLYSWKTSYANLY